MKKKGICIIILMLFSLFIFIGCNKENNETEKEQVLPEATTLMTIRVNPEIGVFMDLNKVVTEVMPLNEDGEIVLSGIDLIGMELNEATDKIIDEIINTGYIEVDEEADVYIDVQGDIDVEEVKEIELGKVMDKIFEKEELNNLKPENEHEIDIISFIDAKNIDPVYFEKSYDIDYTGKGKEYYLFCEALKKTKLVGLAKTVIGNKFYYCILRFNNKNIIMTTLYFEEEVNIKEDNLNLKITNEELDLAVELIKKLKGKFEPNKYKDEYQNNIKEAINDKLEGKEVKTPTYNFITGKREYNGNKAKLTSVG